MKKTSDGQFTYRKLLLIRPGLIILRNGLIPEGAYKRNRKSSSMEIRFVFTGFSIKGQKVTINRRNSNAFGGGWGAGGAYIRRRSFDIRNVLFCLQVAEPITWKACK